MMKTGNGLGTKGSVNRSAVGYVAGHERCHKCSCCYKGKTEELAKHTVVDSHSGRRQVSVMRHMVKAIGAVVACQAPKIGMAVQ